MVAFLAACAAPASESPGARSASTPSSGGGGLATGSTFADDDQHIPGYGKPELARARIAERGAEASAERALGELEAATAGDAADRDARWRTTHADLAVRRRFIATLEACEAQRRWCPPRLDDPAWRWEPDSDRPVPLDAALRFDVDSWRAIARELHGRACACRTAACVDGLGAAIDQLETRPMPAVQGDDAATVSITRARECLARLRGVRPISLPRE